MLEIILFHKKKKKKYSVNVQIFKPEIPTYANRILGKPPATNYKLCNKPHLHKTYKQLHKQKISVGETHQSPGHKTGTTSTSQ